MTLVATSINPMQTSAINDRARCDSAMPRQRVISIGLLEIDENGIGSEKGDHHREEVDKIAQSDDAPGNRIEMAEEAGAGDGGNEPVGRPALEQSEHRRCPRDG